MALDSSLDVDELRSELGYALRAVAVGNADTREYEVLYARPDVDEAYSPEAEDRIFEDLFSEHFRNPAREAAFEPLGELEFTVRSFEGGTVLTCWNDTYVLFVSVEGSEHFVPPTMRMLRDQLERASRARRP